MTENQRSKGRRAIVAAALLSITVVIAAFVVWPRGTSAVSTQDALDDFRAQTGQAPAPALPAAGSVPVEPGVYTYRTVGSEDVKLGMLPSDHRPYPETVTAVVVAGDRADCFAMTLNLLEQHTEKTTYCTEADGSLRLAAHTKNQQVGTLSPVGTMACDPAAIVVPAQTTSTLRCSLTLDGGPAKMTATLTGTSTTEPAKVTVGSAASDATKVTINLAVGGGLSGNWTETLWLASDTRLPLRIQRDLHIEGLATFTERSDLALTTTRPAR